VTVPRGFLPVFSVGSMEEARALLVLACPRNVDHEFVAPELAEAQNLDNLAAFGARLRQLHEQHFAGTDRCACGKGKAWPKTRRNSGRRRKSPSRRR
jgi:hypothetical protein